MYVRGNHLDVLETICHKPDGAVVAEVELRIYPDIGYNVIRVEARNLLKSCDVEASL